jgi:hypothetical protein
MSCGSRLREAVAGLMPGRWRRRLVPQGLRRVVADASLRVRVMAAAAILVALTSVVTGLLGTALLRSYLYSRADAQLRDFAAIASRVLERPHPPGGPGGQQQTLPTQFLVEVVSAGGQGQRTGTPAHDDGGLRLPAAQLRDEGSPFTAAAGSPGHSWRVLVEPLSGGRHAIIAFSPMISTARSPGWR